MVRKASMYALVCGLLLAWGCEQKNEPTSVFNEGVDASGRRLVPIKPPARKLDKGMIAAAASADEAASKKPAGGATGTTTPDAAAIVIDASTPEGIVKAYVEIMAAGDLTQVPDLLVPDQEKIARPLIESLGPLVEPFRQLQSAWAEKFPNDPCPLNQGVTPLALWPVKLKTGSINKISDQEATVDVEPENPTLGKAATYKLKLMDGKWKIEDPSTPSPDKLAEIEKISAAAPKLAEAVQDVAAKITKGELATAKDAQEAVGKAFMAALMGSAMQAPDGTAPKPDEAAPKSDAAPEDKPADAAKPQADNKPDPLDGTFTGPNQLRNKR